MSYDHWKTQAPEWDGPEEPSYEEQKADYEDKMSDDFCLIHGYEHMKQQFGNPIPYCDACESARSMSEKRVTILQQQKAAELALKIDEALALVPQSADGVEVAVGDMLMLGPEISDLLREIGGLPPMQR